MSELLENETNLESSMPIDEKNTENKEDINTTSDILEDSTDSKCFDDNQVDESVNTDDCVNCSEDLNVHKYENFIPKESLPNNYAIASLVLGIFSIVCSFLFFFIIPAILGLASGIVGLVLAVKAKKVQHSNVATGGFVTSIIGISFAAIGAVIAFVAIGIFALIAGCAAMFI